ISQRVPYIIQCVETYDRQAFLAGKGATFHVQRTMVNPTISELVAQAKADFGDGRQVPVQPKPNNGFPAGACAGCGSAKGTDGGNLQQCGRCKSRKYCGKKCQKKDWPKHRVGCKQA
ncbi:MYND finger family protein, partial [Venturia nashicola]